MGPNENRRGHGRGPSSPRHKNQQLGSPKDDLKGAIKLKDAIGRKIFFPVADLQDVEGMCNKGVLNTEASADWR